MYLNTAVGEEELVLNASCNVSVSIISAGFRFCGCQYITGLDTTKINFKENLLWSLVGAMISSLNKEFLCSLSNIAPARGYFYICLNHQKNVKAYYTFTVVSVFVWLMLIVLFLEKKTNVTFSCCVLDINIIMVL